MQLKIFYDHGQTFKTVRFEDSITVQEAIRRFAERTPLYTTADPALYGFYLPETYPYLSFYPSTPPPVHAPSTPPPQPANNNNNNNNNNNVSVSAPTSPTGPATEDTDKIGWLENDRLLSSYNIKDFLLFKKKTSLYPRKISSNFTLTKIHLPTSDKTLKYDCKMTVKEAIQYLKSRNPGVDMTNFGLYLPYSPHDTDGFFLEEDRTISSYDLDYQAELHFVPKEKKVNAPGFTILFSKKQVRRTMHLNSEITLQSALEKLVATEPHLAPSPSPSLFSIDSSSSSSSSILKTEKHGFYIPPYDDGVGKLQEANSSVLYLTHGRDPFIVYQPVKEVEDEMLAHGEITVEVHVVAPSNGGFSKFLQRQTMWASKTGVSLKVKVDEETTVHELRELVKKMLLAQKVLWASSISDYGVYLPHQTDGESLLDDDTPIISTPIPPVGTQFELKPLKRVESFVGDMSSGLQVVVHQYNTRAQNKLLLPVDRTATIGILKEHIFELMANRLTPEQATDYVLTRTSIVDDGELFEDDSRDLNSYKIDLNAVLEFKPRTQYPLPESPLLILSVSITPSPSPSLGSSFLDRPTDIHLRLPILSRSLTVSQITTQLYEMLRNMKNPKLEQTIRHFSGFSLFWQDANLWLNPTRSIISYGIPPKHTVILKVKPIGIYIRVWNYQIPLTLGYFQYPPSMLVADIDKKDLFNMVRSDPNLTQKWGRNRTVSIYNDPPTTTPKSSPLMDVDADIYGFYCIPEKQVGGPEDVNEKPFWLDSTKTIKECGVHEGSVVELKPMPQPLNVIYPDANNARNSVTVKFDMDRPIAYYLPIPVEKNDKVIWQKEPHNPSGLLLDPSQSLSAQGIRPNYGASILLTRQSQNTAKYEDNSIDGQINRDLWEELRAAEPEGVIINSEGQVVAGTVNRLIEHLTNAKVHDLNFMKTFLLTYQAFVNPQIFFSKLVERYHVPAPPDTTDIGNFVENVQRPIQLRVCNVLKKTIDLNFSDFDNALLQEMNQFLETVLIPSNNAGLAQKIQKTLLKNMTANSKPKVNPSIIFDRSPPTSRIGNIASPQEAPKTLIDYDELEIARQLTILEYETYHAIEPTELLNQAWCKPKLMHRSPSILKMIARFNGISSWVTGVIIEPEEIKQRVKVFKKVVNVGRHLLDLNSFNALMALIAGWNNSAILRLKHTKKELSKKTQDEITHLESLMSSEGSYKRYRAYLHTANPPQIPYIGIYLSDLTFIEEGNDDTIKGLVNFEKMRMLCNVILELQQYQQQPYNLTRIPELADMVQKELSATASEETIYQKSLLREPRGASRDDIR